MTRLARLDPFCVEISVENMGLPVGVLGFILLPEKAVLDKKGKQKTTKQKKHKSSLEPGNETGTSRTAVWCVASGPEIEVKLINCFNVMVRNIKNKATSFSKKNHSKLFRCNGVLQSVANDGVSF